MLSGCAGASRGCKLFVGDWMKAALFVAVFFSIVVAIFFSIISALVLSGKQWRAAQDRAHARRIAEYRMNARLLRLNI
jgi:hypothetical protein